MVDDRISKVAMSGDFFLEPPEALAHIAAALEGAATDRSEGELATRIRERYDSPAWIHSIP